MKIETRPFAPAMVSIPDQTSSRLAILTVTWTLSWPSGFRLLDELDLARYWIPKAFARGSHVLDVKNGGWSAEEDVLQSFETERREWLVVSGNACVSVFCSLEPELMDVSWKNGIQAA